MLNEEIQAAINAASDGDTVTVDVWVAEKNLEERTLVWQASARNQDGLEVLKAWATLKFPRKKPAPPQEA